MMIHSSSDNETRLSVPPFLKTARISAVDWDSSPLGPIENWSPSLRASAGVCLHSLLPSMLCWGKKMTALYNDAFQEAFVPDLNASMGKPLRDVFPKMWSDYGSTLMEEVFERGNPARVEIRSPVWKMDPSKTSPYIGLAFTPVFDETGGVGGVFITAWALAHPLNPKKSPGIKGGLFQSYFESIATPMAVIDTEYYFVQVNEAFTRLTGYSDDDLKRKTIAHILAPEDLPESLSALRQLANGDIPSFSIEKKYIAKDGSLIWTRNNVATSRNDAGEPFRFILQIEDLRKARAREKALRENDLQFKQALDSLPYMIFTANQAGEMNYFNSAWYGYTGFEDTGSLSQRRALLHPDDREKSAAAWFCSLETGKPMEIEFRMADRKNPGIYRWFLSRAVAIRNDADEIVKWIGAIADIDDLKRIEQTLRESEERFRHLAEESPIFVWTRKNESGFDYLNQRFADYIGYTGAEKIGEKMTEAVHPDDFDRVFEVLQQAIDRQSPYEMEVRIKENKTGTYRWFMFKAVPNGEGEKFDGFIGTGIDVHDRKMAALELERLVAESAFSLSEANRRLENSNIELQQFAYTASHDLQEPLRKIRTFAGLLAERGQNLGERDRQYIQKISDSSARMSTLITDLLQFSRTSQMEQTFELVDLNVALHCIQEDLEALADQKKATIIADLLPTIEAIPVQMNQLFFNLLSNALKFSRPEVPPEIRVQCRRLAPEEIDALPAGAVGGGYFEMIVTDNGMGFDEAFGEKIFEIFQRLHERSAFVGSGIGLALCRKIADNHHGYISARSKPGEGSAFTVILPEKQG